MSDDNSWVFDSLVCFLHGPIWNAPLQTFIEEKSLIFDPNIQSDDNNVDYKRLHEEYKQLVDFMLGSFMNEMLITPEQFEFACLEGRNGQGSLFSFHQGLFQQIWAANDIKIFIRMMTQRNVELQLQALDLIERRQISQSSESADVPDDDTSAVLAASTTLNSEINELNSPTKIPLDVDNLIDEEIEKEITKEINDEASTSTITNEPPRASIDLIKKQENIDKNILLPSTIEKIDDKFKRLNLFFDNEKINNEDIKMRQEYLRSQRDKIIEIKKKARTYQLNETIKKNSTRPSSAQLAQKLLQGDQNDVNFTEQNINQTTSMQLRKTLAKRLRSEVVDTDDAGAE